MEYFINCNSSPLAEYNTPLDKIRAEHLYRRLGFSASVQTINAAVGDTAGNLVDNLVNQALAAPVIPAPEWADWTNANYPEDDDLARQIRRAQQEEFTLSYVNSLLDNNLRDRMSFFWSNHFVTELDVYNCNSFLYYYINCLQRNALGNFRTFVSEIGLTSAMLYYLDGVRNRGNNPNENYARELYELFTLGEGNGYTEEDIIETSKSLSGYTERGEEGCTQVTFNPEHFNTENKTIFGQTGNWDYDDTIDILFTQKADLIAGFICKKLYEFFVHPDSTNDEGGNAPDIINGMAQRMVSSNFEIAPVLSELFKSQHFFDETAIGVIIKSPFDLYLNFFKETNFTYDDSNLSFAIGSSELLGQELFDPFDVAGWQRDREWINTNFIIGRWLSMEELLANLHAADKDQFITFGIEATNATGADGASENDPEVVARAIIDKITPKGLLEDSQYDAAITVFREPFENTNMFENGSWDMSLPMNTDVQVYLLLRHLVRQPEFQLK
ncbi:DUF1800 domain-containing protein [Flagellimonas sp. HMM57]|uniref:DUF1800 domain-containing protein n=1 Tax=unclassified Flagellimonas TaxID=2644544 RepID=UPI0013CF8C3F|nr:MULTISPECIES: DUF1800 domain-containing protein [unclassified Flagellimonas]UII77282.1 DUF1800 domain-containing protein [Flagellimonas sp. HMM57]